MDHKVISWSIHLGECTTRNVLKMFTQKHLMMKNIFLALLFAFLTSATSLAQTFTVYPNDSMETQIDVSRSADQWIYFINTSNGPITYDWTVTTQTFPSQWIVQLCDNKVCRNLPFAGTRMAAVLPGDSGYLHLTTVPQNIAGDLRVIVHVFDSLQPSQSVDVTFLVHAGTTAAAQPQLREQLSLSPNPAIDVLHLRARSGALPKGTVRLYDLRGHVVATQAVSAQAAAHIDIKALEAGIYLLRYETAQGTVTEKVVVTR